MSARRPLRSVPAKVPLHRFCKTALERLHGAPTRLAPELRGVHRVAPVVAGAILHELDQLLIAARLARTRLVEQRAKRFHDLQVGLLAFAADVVGLAGASLLQDGLD